MRSITFVRGALAVALAAAACRHAPSHLGPGAIILQGVF